MDNIEKEKTEKKKIYHDKAKNYLDMLKDENIKIDAYKKELANPKNEHKKGYILINMSKSYTKIVSLNLVISDIFFDIFKVKYESMIKDARIKCGNGLKCLEEVVTNYFELEVEESENILNSIVEFNIEEKFVLIKEVGFYIDYLFLISKHDLKFKWNIIDFHQRLAIISKNFINPKDLAKKKDPMHNRDNHLIWFSYINLTARLLQNSATMLREKYEMFGIADRSEAEPNFLKALELLKSLSIFYFRAEDFDKQANIKKQIEIWEQKLRRDKEKAAKKEEG